MISCATDTKKEQQPQHENDDSELKGISAVLKLLACSNKYKFLVVKVRGALADGLAAAP